MHALLATAQGLFRYLPPMAVGPVGTGENSPGIHAWETSEKKTPSPVAPKPRRGPSGRVPSGGRLKPLT